LLRRGDPNMHKGKMMSVKCGSMRMVSWTKLMTSVS
jgi:hypothetical protein